MKHGKTEEEAKAVCKTQQESEIVFLRVTHSSLFPLRLFFAFYAPPLKCSLLEEGDRLGRMRSDTRHGEEKVKEENKEECTRFPKNLPPRSPSYLPKTSYLRHPSKSVFDATKIELGAGENIKGVIIFPSFSPVSLAAYALHLRSSFDVFLPPDQGSLAYLSFSDRSYYYSLLPPPPPPSFYKTLMPQGEGGEGGEVCQFLARLLVAL